MPTAVRVQVVAPYHLPPLPELGVGEIWPMLAFPGFMFIRLGTPPPSNLMYSYGGIKSIVFALLTLIGLIGGFFNPFQVYYVVLLCVRD